MDLNPDTIIEDLERECRERSERVREMLREKGRDDLVKEFDAAMWRVSSGVQGARGIWHALSGAQRDALEAIAKAPNERALRDDKRYLTFNGDEVGRPKTIACLQKRLLVRWVGEWGDPTRIAMLTGHGRFVLKHGPQPTVSP